MSFQELNSEYFEDFQDDDLISFQESQIESNQTVQFYEDRTSHQISGFQVEPDLFEITELKMYDSPVDSIPVPTLSAKEITSLKKKFEEYKKKKTVEKEKPSRPIVKSPLNSSKNRSVSPLVPVKTQPSYKKPLITLLISIYGKEVTEQLYDGDYSIDVAKKVFSQISAKPSQAELKTLALQIEENVSSYLLEVSNELQKFHQNSKKILEQNTKKKLEKIKPPLLLTERRANEKRPVLGSLSLQIENKEISVTVKDGDNPQKLADKICENYSLSKDYLPQITKEIRDLQDRSNKSFLFRLEFEVNGKIAELALYENEDLAHVSQKFCRDHKLGREYISKIQDILQKQLNNVS